MFHRAASPIALLLLLLLSHLSCPTLCDPIDSSPPGSAIPGILQARTLEWGAISFSNAWKWKVKVKLLSRVRLFATPWTAAHQAPPSMGFSRQEYWSGVPLPSPPPGLHQPKSSLPALLTPLQPPPTADFLKLQITLPVVFIEPHINGIIHLVWKPAFTQHHVLWIHPK